MAEHPDCTDPRVGDLLAAYELGILDTQRSARFERHAASCEACQESLFAAAPAALAVQEDPVRYRRAAEAGRKRRTAPILESWWQRLSDYLAPRLLVPVATAAAAVLALVLLLPVDGQRLGDLARVEPVPYTLMHTRSEADAAEELFRQGMAAYVARDYGAAASRLAEALEAADDDWRLGAQARFYRGLSLLLVGRAQSSLAPLTAAAQGAPRPLAERAAWYRAQALLTLGDGAAARDVLAGLTDSPVYGERARTQLAQMAELLD